MNNQAAGVLDWCNSYALNQFYDPVDERRIIWGWSDEDINHYGVMAQGFQGSLGVPRETFMLKTHNVSAPLRGLTEGPDPWVEQADRNQFSVTTIGQKPVPEVVTAIQGNQPTLAQ